MTGATLAPGRVDDVPAAGDAEPAPNNDVAAADGVVDDKELFDEPKVNKFVLEVLLAAAALAVPPVTVDAAIFPNVGKLPNVVFEFLPQIFPEGAVVAPLPPSAATLLPLAIIGVILVVFGNFASAPNVFVLMAPPPTPKLNVGAAAAAVAVVSEDRLPPNKEEPAGFMVFSVPALPPLPLLLFMPKRFRGEEVLLVTLPNRLLLPPLAPAAAVTTGLTSVAAVLLLTVLLVAFVLPRRLVAPPLLDGANPPNILPLVPAAAAVLKTLVDSPNLKPSNAPTLFVVLDDIRLLLDKVVVVVVVPPKPIEDDDLN